MVPEASYARTETGVVPEGGGWFVINAKDARWYKGSFGAFTRFEGRTARFDALGVNIGVLEPGEPSCMYHGEDEQEDFLVIAGECLLLIEGEERSLKTWDFVHCPAWAEHVFVGAGAGPCAILAVGTRTGGAVIYPDSELARSHGAGVEAVTSDPGQAYAGTSENARTSYREGWLPT